MPESTVRILSHTAITSLTLIVYGVLTGLGYDATPVLGILAGQALGAGVEQVARRSTP